MKRPIVLGIIGLVVCVCAMARELTGTERMAVLTKLTGLSGVTFSDEEEQALKAAHSALLKISQSPGAVQLFWPQVQGYSPTMISWAEAKRLILNGHVRSVMQTHSLTVSLTTENGQVYSTKEESIDEVFGLIHQVDPKGVFISYATE